MLLRFFVHFYDMEIIEEEAFLSWKEDVNQEYPGKGKALFQVLSSLNPSLLYPHDPSILKLLMVVTVTAGEPVADLAGDGRGGGV